jgi:LPXTG-motif cell wall-anchored protein
LLRVARSVPAVACALAAVVGLGVAGAAGAQTSTGGFGAAPAHPDPADPASRAYFRPVLAPGESSTDEVLVTSSSDSPLQLLISPVDGLTGQTSGAVYANRDAAVKKAGAWINPSISTLSLAPHGRQQVSFRVVVPRDAVPGDHLGGIAVEDANPQHSGGQFSITQVFRTVVGVDVVVPGPAAAGLRLGHLALKALPGTAVATLSIQLADTGRKLVKPNLAVSLRGPSAYRRYVGRQLDTVLPGDSIAYPFIWPDGLVPGVYHVVVRATGGPRPIAREATLRLGTALHGAVHPSLPSTSSFPLAWALVIGLAAVLALIVLAWIVRARRRRRSRYQPRHAPPRGRRPTPGATGRTRPRPDRVRDVDFKPAGRNANAPTR